jgi:hypothetical protein
MQNAIFIFRLRWV